MELEYETKGWPQQHAVSLAVSICWAEMAGQPGCLHPASSRDQANVTIRIRYKTGNVLQNTEPEGLRSEGESYELHFGPAFHIHRSLDKIGAWKKIPKAGAAN